MSELSRRLDDYLALRRGLGHELADAARLLPRFVAHLDGHGDSTVTVATALEWAQLPDVPAGSTVHCRRLTAVRGFAHYLSGFDADTQVPPLGLLSCRQRWAPPFVLNADDVASLMRQADISLAPSLRAATYRTVVGLLAVTGMRIGEVIAADGDDVDLRDGVVRVRESKFGKSRLVPLHPTTTHALRDYARQREQVRPAPRDPAFFISRTGRRLCYQVVRSTFRQLCDASGVGTGSTSPPRLHDLRHSFAVHTLVDWYRAGEDVRASLPVLSTYLGHRDPRSTYWYLSAAPELLALAAQRLERPAVTG